MIEIQSISQQFDGPDGPVNAVNNVSLSIEKGEIFGIIGRSGAGKSSLIRTLNLLNKPTSGKVILDNQDMTNLDANELRLARRGIGMIFQHFNLLSSRTVAKNIALPLELSGLSQDKINKRVDQLLELVGLSDQRDRYPSQISGGQKQRVGIARALANEPKVLLSDEATSALDPETTRSILELLKRINRELGLTIVLITHQMEVIKMICDKVAVMEKGNIIEQGNVLDVFQAPAHAITRSMIGDAIAQGLPGGALTRLREQLKHSDTDSNYILRLSFVGSSVEQPILSEAVRRFNIDFSILHGQIDEIQDQAFGSLVILAQASREQIKEAIEFMTERGVHIEELKLKELSNELSND